MGETRKTNKQILEESALALENKYIAFFENDFATESSNKRDKIKIENLKEKFCSDCFDFAYKDTRSYIYKKYQDFYNKNFGQKELFQLLEGEFSDAIIFILNEIFIRALVVIHIRGNLNIEEIKWLMAEGVRESYLFKNQEIEKTKFFEKSIKQFEKRFEEPENYNNIIGWIQRIVFGNITGNYRSKKRWLSTKSDLLVENEKIIAKNVQNFGGKHSYISRFPPVAEKYRILFWLSENYINHDGSKGMSGKRIAAIYNTSAAYIKEKKKRAKKDIINPKKERKIKKVLVQPDYKETPKISPEEEASLYHLLIIENNEAASKIFKELLKDVKEYWVLIRLKWIENPSDLALTDLYNLEIEELESISNYYKSLLLGVLKEKKIL